MLAVQTRVSAARVLVCWFARRVVKVGREGRSGMSVGVCSLQCALIDAAPPVCPVCVGCRLPLVLACRRRVCVGVSAAAARVCWFARRVG